MQQQLGIADKVRQLQSQTRDRARANDLSVRMEVQADCFSGIWAHHANRTRQILEQGDLESALTAAAAIGDDRQAGRRGLRKALGACGMRRAVARAR